MSQETTDDNEVQVFKKTNNVKKINVAVDEKVKLKKLINY
jgi:hypothetical protein